MEIVGRCHCGNIAFLLTVDPSIGSLPARACACSFCTKHGGVWTSSPSGSLRVEIAKITEVSRYAFGTKTATFHICAICGVVPVVTSEVEGRLYAVANVNALEGISEGMLERGTVSFDEEGESERLARRASSWIREVEFVHGAA